MVAGAARSVDVAVLGATGFTGKLACEYLSNAYSGSGSYLVAGRSQSKMAKLRNELGLPEDCVRIVDCTDANAVESLVKECRVVANFAGTPFADKALPIVEACVKHGTHYVDITGEVHLHRASYDAYHEQAVASKSLIVHSCGYDSVPSDLGAYLAVKKLEEAHGVKCSELRTFAGESKGGISGGTLATALGALTGKIRGMPGVDEAKARGVYALDPKGVTAGSDTSDAAGGVGYDARVDTWYMPNIMASVNAPVVRKSAALLGYSSTPNGCSYAEVAASGSRLKAIGSTMAMALGGLLLAFPPLRAALFHFKVLPRPGEGPSLETRNTGFFHTYVLGVGEQPAASTADAPMVVADFKSGTAGDPGYKATALMAIEAAMCLARQRDECEPAGGVLTPASAMGRALVQRLNRAGMQLSARLVGGK